MRVLTASEMKAAEAAAVKAGSSYCQLMENAGTATAAEMERLAAEQQLPHSALFLCGKGNNAGDAFVAARLLAVKGWRCTIVLLLGKDFSPLADENYRLLPQQVACHLPSQIDYNTAFVVDAVFGTGFRGTLSPNVQQVFRQANKTCCLRIALDLPSGLNCDTGEQSAGCFTASYTFTFGAYKPALLMEGSKPVTGKVLCLAIGL